MLFINTAIALTFLPAILSAPASADLPSRNGFEDDISKDFSTDFEAHRGRGASAFDDEDEFEPTRSHGVNTKSFNGQRSFDDDYFESIGERGGGLDSDIDFDDRLQSGRNDDFGDEDFTDIDDSEYYYPTQTDGKTIMKTKPSPTTYIVIVKTGDKWFSGTHARPFLHFADANGNRVNSFLNRRLFERKSVHIFKISTFAQLDDVCTITLGDDFSGFFPQW
jgi:hypothetical protein